MQLKTVEIPGDFSALRISRIVEIVRRITSARVINLTGAEYDFSQSCSDSEDAGEHCLFIVDHNTKFSWKRNFESILAIGFDAAHQFDGTCPYGTFEITIIDGTVLYTKSKRVREFFDPENLDILRCLLLSFGSGGDYRRARQVSEELLERQLHRYLTDTKSSYARHEELVSGFVSLCHYADFQDYKVHALVNDSTTLVKDLKAELNELRSFFNAHMQVAAPRLAWRLIRDTCKKLLGIKFHDPRNVVSQKLDRLCDIRSVAHPEFNHIVRQYWRHSALSFLRRGISSEIAAKVNSFKYQPLVSVIVAVHNVEAALLEECLRSILCQSYGKFELIIVDDNSSMPDVARVIEQYARMDSRIKGVFNPVNMHICGASNIGLERAQGDFVTFIDHDDTITGDAFYEMVALLNKNDKLDFIYSDEDLITNDGVAHSPIFKPDWSPETMLSMMYTTHLAFYRTSIAKELGGYREGFEGAQDYDFVLRFSERVPAAHIAHIPKVLYHWRMTEGSTALSGVDAKPYALSSSRRAIEDAIDRRKLSAKRVDGILPFSHRVTYEIQGEPLVSIIIPFRDQPEFLKRCVFSVLEKSSYKNIEILLVDNDSREGTTQEVLKSFTQHKNIRILRYEKPFNYSAINNFAANAAQGQYVCLLNNDVEVITPEWLSTLLEYAQLPEIGAVGAKLLYPNGKVQHGGIILGLGGYCAHSHRFSNHDDYGFMGRLVNIGNIMAVTGACLLVSKDKFFEVGGLDETKFPIAYNDVDLCLKLHTAGYRNIFNPHAKLYHYESVSRGEDNVDIEKSIRFSFEKENLKQKWKEYIARDPYYNPHLTLDAEDFSLKEIAFGPDLCSVATVRKALSQM